MIPLIRATASSKTIRNVGVPIFSVYSASVILVYILYSAPANYSFFQGRGRLPLWRHHSCGCDSWLLLCYSRELNDVFHRFMTADIIRNATLVIATGMASACWATVVVFSSGTFHRSTNSLLAHCKLEAFVMWASAGILCNASFLRVYRHWKLLYRKDRSMWLTEVRGDD